jgi:DNA-binding SARP family transcriptional activator
MSFWETSVTVMATRGTLDGEFPVDAPLVILHPNFPNQHLILAQVLTRTNRTPIFFSLQTTNSDLSAAWGLFTMALKDQVGRVPPSLEAKATPEKAAQAALKALNPAQPYMLVIDAVDLGNRQIEAWIAALAKGLPENSQIIVGARRLPLSLLAGDTNREIARLYPVDPERMLLDYASQPADRALLEVYGLGPGQALINGQRIDRWDGMLPRALFFYFIDRGMVTRDEIFHTFWPTLTVREATNVFHVTKRKISEILGFDLTVYWSGFYRISPDIDLHYDVVKFAEHVQNSVVAADDQAVELLQRAIDLYQSVFLSTLDMEWVQNRRNELNLTYSEALSSLGKIRQRQGRPQEALGLLLRAAVNQPHREDLARGIMSLFTELGQPEKALEVYERLTAELKHSLGVAPDRRTVELAQQIRASA